MTSLALRPEGRPGVRRALDRLPHALARRRSDALPELMIEQAKDAGSHDLDRSIVQVGLAIRNVGRGTAKSYWAEARTRQDEEVGLHLPDPSHPGDATFRRQGNNEIIEWRSADPWRPEQTRLIRFHVIMPMNRRVLLAMKVLAPGVEPIRRRIEVIWSGAEPVIQVVTPL